MKPARPAGKRLAGKAAGMSALFRLAEGVCVWDCQAPIVDEVRDVLRLDHRPRSEVILRTWRLIVEDQGSPRLTEAGMSAEEATSACSDFSAQPDWVAGQMYEAHSQGSWGQALMGALPHQYSPCFSC